MKNILSLNKPIGLTPLQAIFEFKKQNPIYQHEKISYAGRLDPMAQGLLILLVNEENINREKFENLTKTYEFTALLGIETDTYDLLGKITSIQNDILDIDEKNLLKIVKSFQGKQIQHYPPYSSKTVHGKPLYWWARNGRISEIVIPKKEIEIYNVELLSLSKITTIELKELVTKRIIIVQGNFRQAEILRIWQDYFNSTSVKSYQVLKCVASCSSGTYIRSLAMKIGVELKTGAIVTDIKRTKVGNYLLEEAVNI